MVYAKAIKSLMKKRKSALAAQVLKLQEQLRTKERCIEQQTATLDDYRQELNAYRIAEINKTWEGVELLQDGELVDCKPVSIILKRRNTI